MRSDVNGVMEVPVLRAMNFRWRQLRPPRHVTHTHATWIVCIRATAAPPEPFSGEYVGVPPALICAVDLVAEHFVTNPAFEPINGTVHNTDVLGGAADVSRANE